MRSRITGKVELVELKEILLKIKTKIKNGDL